MRIDELTDYKEMTKELSSWLRSNHITRISYRDLLTDFPLKRHLLNRRSWMKVLRKGEKARLWQLGPGRSKGSIVLTRRSKSE